LPAEKDKDGKEVPRRGERGEGKRGDGLLNGFKKGSCDGGLKPNRLVRILGKGRGGEMGGGRLVWDRGLAEGFLKKKGLNPSEKIWAKKKKGSGVMPWKPKDDGFWEGKSPRRGGRRDAEGKGVAARELTRGQVMNSGNKGGEKGKGKAGRDTEGG